MIKIQPYSVAKQINFGNYKAKQNRTEQSIHQEENIMNSLNALMAHNTLVSQSTQKMLQELRALGEAGYPEKDMAELEYKAFLTAKQMPGPVAFPNHPLSIWGDLYVDLNDKSKLPDSAKGLMAKDIARVMSGNTKMKEVVDPKVWSISYEYTNPVGGQTDIAREMPVAMNEAGVDTLAISPMFNISVDGKPTNFISQEDGKLFYNTPGNKTEVVKVYEGDLQTGDKTNTMSVYYGEFGKQKQPTLFLYDNDMFNFGETGNANVYQDLPHSQERVRMAQFNNMAYEALAKAKEGEFKMPDGVEIEAPDKIVAHEAWQSGGLLGKLRLYSRAEDVAHSRKKATTDYLRDVANNTAVVVHNLGNAYQGQNGSKEVMEGYFNTLYGDFAREIVENSCIADVGNRKFGLFGTPSQRIGFYEGVLNPAHGAAVLATSIGPVSEGYKSEIINDGISSNLDTVMGIKAKKGSLTAFPNGVDKAPLTASEKNVAQINEIFAQKIEEVVSSTAQVKPYSADDTLVDFMRKKVDNKYIFGEVLRDAVRNNTEATPLIHGNKSPDFYKGTFGIDIEDISVDTPIFSMASRLDSQKGFDTMVDAYAKVVEDYDVDDPNMPVLIISGGGDQGLANYIKDVKDSLGEKGKRILFTQNRISVPGLLFMNMTTRNCMPSDFEPYGISELKGLYAGSHVIATEVGGMKSEGEISRKIYSYDDYGADKANAMTVKDYEFMCLAPDWEKGAVRERNAEKLANAIRKDIALSNEDSAKMDMNGLKTDVSWDKGAIQNYMNEMKIKVSK